MRLIIKWHHCISEYIRLYVRHCYPYVENRKIHVTHLHRRLHMRTLTLTSVGAAQVLSTRV